MPTERNKHFIPTMTIEIFAHLPLLLIRKTNFVFFLVVHRKEINFSVTELLYGKEQEHRVFRFILYQAGFLIHELTICHWRISGPGIADRLSQWSVYYFRIYITSRERLLCNYVFFWRHLTITKSNKVDWVCVIETKLCS